METNNSHKSFTDLLAWQEARILKNRVRQLTKCFPQEEKFRFTDQIIRSSGLLVAIFRKDMDALASEISYVFVCRPRGSLSETHNHLIDALDCGYIDEIVFKDFIRQIKKVEQLLNGYITYLKKAS